MNPRRCWSTVVVAALLTFASLAAVVPAEAFACGGYGPSVEIVARCGDKPCRDAEIVLMVNNVRRTARTDAEGRAWLFVSRAGAATVAAMYHRGEQSERVASASTTFKPFETARVELDLVPTGGSSTVAAR